MSKFIVVEGSLINRVMLEKRSPPYHGRCRIERCLVDSFKDPTEAHSYALRLNAVSRSASDIGLIPDQGSGVPKNMTTRSQPARRVVLYVPVIRTATDSLVIAKAVFNGARVACMDKDWFTVKEVAKTTKRKAPQVRRYLMDNLREHFKRRIVAGVTEFSFKDKKVITAAVEFVNADQLQQRDFFV